VESLESELARARSLDVAELADAVEAVGFECTRCGACCKGYDGAEEDGDGDGEGREPHTATVFPDEVRELEAATGEAWRDVARPMPFGLDDADGATGETFEWALQTDACGDCTFYAEGDDGRGACTVHDSRPLICRTYPFSVALSGTSHPMGAAVDSVDLGGDTPDGGRESDGDADGTADGASLRVHECEGLGREMSREDAEELATVLKERAVRELEEAVGVRDSYEPRDEEGVVVHDSEGAKRPDGTPLDADR
jgi:hypothetical protein